MSEPWIPEPAPENAPGPAAQIWTATYQDQAGLMRRVPVFAVTEHEANYWARKDTREGERLVSVDQGGRLR